MNHKGTKRRQRLMARRIKRVHLDESRYSLASVHITPHDDARNELQLTWANKERARKQRNTNV